MRYILCRPEGGLNDQLNQVAKCVNYGRKFGRLVMLDAVRCGFGESYHHYLEPLSADIVNDSDTIQQLIAPIWGEVYPAHLSTMGFFYQSIYDERTQNFIAVPIELPLSFDFSRDSNAPLLVHHACGGGTSGIEGLLEFKLSTTIRELVLSRRKALPETYFSIHVRHTDYKTNYREVFHELAKHELFAVRKIPLYLASDNPEVIAAARNMFSVPVFNFSHLPPATAGLHNTKVLPKSVVNTDAICDLALLAMGAGFFAPTMVQGSYSGFSVLADQLRKAPKGVERLLGAIA